MAQSPLFERHVAAGASHSDSGGWHLVDHFGDAEAELTALQTGAALLDLAPVGVAELSGEEVRRWCHGMFTNHVKRLRPGQGNRHAMCNDRGGVLGVLDLYCIADDRFLAVFEGVDADWFQAHYRMYLILDDIEVEPLGEESDGPWLLSVQGPGAAAVLASAGLPVPAEDHGLEALDGGTDWRTADGSAITAVMRKDRAGTGGFDVLVPTDALAATWTALAEAGAAPTGQLTLDAARIAAGRARWPVDGGEKTVVHHLRLESEVCNFEKGCYVGQEVINRMDVKAKVGRRLTLLELDGAAAPGAGVVLDDKSVGALTSVSSIGGVVRALGVLRQVAWQPGTQVTIATEPPRTATVVAPAGSEA